MDSFARLVVGLSVMSSAACSNFREYEWTEQVEFSTGATAVAESWYKCRKVMDVGAGFQRGCLYEEASIRVRIPEPINEAVDWRGYLVPFVLDMADGSLYFIGRFGAAWHIDYWKPQNCEFYVAFKREGGVWQRIRIAELPRSLKPNLLQNMEALFENTSFLSPNPSVSMKQKAELDAKLYSDDLKRVVISPNCEK
jgi:hypothetical protein